MIPIKPAGYKILVKQVVVENTTASGLILSTFEEQQRQQAGFPLYEVLAMGPACYKARDGVGFPEGDWCKVGDTVLMDSYAGKTFQPKEFFMFNEEDEEAKAELKAMQEGGLRFHLVNDDSVMGVLKK
jgi:co-chaperonin GroES (HSP10)